METKFNFKSQVCTDKIQSERLLALGLKKETADMCYQIKYWDCGLLKECSPSLILHNIIDGDSFITAWSLDRLREMLNKSGVTISFVERDTSIIVERYGVFQKSYDFWDDMYDNICDAIEWLIKEGYFNKEYLNGDD